MHTTTNDDTATTIDETTASDPATESRLRWVLAANTTTSGLGGVVAIVLAGPVDTLLGTGAVGAVRLVGAGLVLFAAFVAFVARSPRPRLVREVPMISAGDLAWVAATAVTIAREWYSGWGATVMGVVALMVGAFGVMQAVLVRRLRSDH